MASINDLQYSRDKEGNLFELKGRKYLYGDTLGNLDTATAAAAAGNTTLTADSSARWVVDVCRAVVASIAANTTVTVTVDTGADTYVFGLSTNGIHDLFAMDQGVLSILADANTAVTMASSSAGTGGTVTLLLGGHKIPSADV